MAVNVAACPLDSLPCYHRGCASWADECPRWARRGSLPFGLRTFHLLGWILLTTMLQSETFPPNFLPVLLSSHECLTCILQKNSHSCKLVMASTSRWTQTNAIVLHFSDAEFWGCSCALSSICLVSVATSQFIPNSDSVQGHCLLDCPTSTIFE